MTCAGPACPDGPARGRASCCDKILNHQSGTISGVAAVYQRTIPFGASASARPVGRHIGTILNDVVREHRSELKVVA